MRINWNPVALLALLASLAWLLLVFLQARGADTIDPASGEEEAAAHLFEIARDRADRYGIVGAQVGTVGSGGHRSVSIGWAGDGRPVTGATRFNVGSVSKPVTAWTVASLAQEGRIDLDRPIADYLEQFSLPESEFDAGEVTVRRLLQHRGGTNIIGYSGYPGEDQPARPFREAAVMPATLAESSRTNYPVAVVREPGSRRVYSGGGYSLLQMAVEDVSGTTFADAMQAATFEPLGMANASFDPNAPGETSASFTHSGTPLEEMRFLALAAAGLYASGDDMAAFLSAHFDPANAAVVEELLEEQPDSPRFATAYTREAREGRTLYGHGGNNSSWHAQIYLVPETRQGFYFLTNTTVGAQFEIDVSCAWKSWAMGGAMGSDCEEMFGLTRNLTLAAAGVFVLAILAAVWLVARIRTGRLAFSLMPRGRGGWGTFAKLVGVVLLLPSLALVLALRFHDFFYWRQGVDMIDEIALHELRLLVPAVIALLAVAILALCTRPLASANRPTA